MRVPHNPLTMTIVRRLLAVLPRGAFGRGVMTLVAGTGSAQAIVIATSPILTRLYSPSDFGVFVVATSILSVLITVTCLRYDFALPLPREDATAASVLALSLLANIVMTMIAGVALWLIAPWFLGLFGATVLVPFVWVISLAQFGGGLVSTFTNWAVRTKTFSQIAATRLTQSITLVITQVGLGSLGAGPVGLLIGDAAGRYSGSIRLARTAWRSHARAFKQVTWPDIRAAASRYRRFPIYSTGSALLATLGLQLPILLLVAVYGPGTGGLFALAARICAIPLTLIANAVGQVFVSESAHLVRDDPAGLRPLFRRTTWALARGAIGPAILIMVLAPLLAGPVFGGDWAQTGIFVAILVPSYYLEFVAGATGDILYVVERQDLQLGREILRFVLLGGSIPLAAMLGLTATQAVAVLSATGVLNYTVYGMISWWAIRAARVHPHDKAETIPAGSRDDPDPRWS
jgi:O-antigen/teichoic acid export membrane protein